MVIDTGSSGAAIWAMGIPLVGEVSAWFELVTGAPNTFGVVLNTAPYVTFAFRGRRYVKSPNASHVEIL